MGVAMMQIQMRDYVLLAYRAFRGEMRGKTQLQKRIYFLGTITKEIGKLGFGPHYYGPYSPLVANANDQLLSLCFLEENIQHLGGVSEDGYEIVRHDFKLTEAGKQIAGIKAEEFPCEWEQIRDTAEMIFNAGNPGHIELSLAAKAYFLLMEQDGKATPQAIEDLAPKFKWNLDKGAIKEAVDFLEEIHLAHRENE